MTCMNQHRGHMNGLEYLCVVSIKAISKKHPLFAFVAIWKLHFGSLLILCDVPIVLCPLALFIEPDTL